jgi:murein L,D-transpeptidase YcbB/YkuD
LSASVLRYLSHLHLGRVDPAALGFRLSRPNDDHDWVTLLHDALVAGDVTALVQAFAPPSRQYRALRAQLARYRRLAADPTLVPWTSPVVVRPQDATPNLGALTRLLVAVGDLEVEAAPAAPSRYDGALVTAVQRFQARHALQPDGVIGSATLRALGVPLAHRVMQIELALERLRWLPHPPSSRAIVVNIPMFHLWAWEGQMDIELPDIDMGVIVGRALNTRTPILDATMTHLIFRPYWNVPVSIVKTELLPILLKDLAYLERERFEIVAGPRDDSPVLPPTAESVEALARGEARLRQLPGPENALGLVKFVFVNDADVYMHGTPAQSLFGRARRDFSHGCVRVERPIDLAAWALGDPDAWPRDRIAAAMEGTTTERVNLTRPVSVLLFYLTAMVAPSDNAIFFAEDIYGHDARLAAALAPPR